MAKKLRDEDLVLNIIVNGNQGKKEIGELARFIRDTKQEVSLLEQEEKKLREAGKQNTVEFRQLTSELKKKGEAIQQAQTKMMQLGQTLKLTEMTSTDLKNAWTSLFKLMNKSVPGSEEWAKYKEQLAAVEERMGEVKEMSERTDTTITDMAGKFNHYIGLFAAWGAGLVASLSGITSAVDEFAKMDDTMGGVQKTTGLTKDEVVALNDELKKIDTRTGQEDLLGLARVAGKLGISAQQDVEGFVRATDQIVVALNEDLGGDVEETVNQVGKLVDIFNIKDDFGIEKALLKTGSAINDLGAAGTANEGYLVNFAQRVAGVAPAANISIQNILGLAAMLDSLGQEAEASGTVFNNTIPDMFQNTDVYAKAANMSLEEFSSLLKNDANEAFIRVLEGIRGNNDGMEIMVQRLGDLGVDGSRATSVLQALANKTDDLRKQQEIANQSFADGTSVGKEYNTMNTTAQAELEKARKKLHLLVVELGSLFYPAMTASNNLMSMGVGILSSLITFIGKHGKALAVITAAVVAYNAVVAIQNALSTEGIILRNREIALSKLKVFWTNAVTASYHLASVAIALFSGNLSAAKAEMLAFNAIVRLNPLAAIIGVVVAAGVAIYAYSKKVEAAHSAHKNLTDSALKQKEAVNSLVNGIDPLLKRYDELKNKTNLNKSEQKELQSIIQNIAEKVPSAATAFDKFGNALDINKDKVKKYIQEQKNLLNYQNKAAIAANVAETNRLAGLKYAQTRLLNNMVKKGLSSNEELDAIRNNIKQFEADINGLRAARKQLNGDFLDQPKNDFVQPVANASKKLTEMTVGELKAKLEVLNESIEHTVKGSKQYKEIAKEIADIDKILNSEKIEAKENKKSQSEADRKKKEQADLLKAQQEFQVQTINSQKTLVEQEVVAHEERLKKAGLFGKKKADLNAQEAKALESLEKIHQNNLGKIDADAITKHLNEKQKTFEKELANVRIKNNLELASIKTLSAAKGELQDTLSAEELEKITTLEQAKKAIKERNLQEEDKMTAAHLSGLVSQLQTAINSGDFAGIKLSDKVFSEEELAVLSERLGIAREKVAEILSQVKGAGGGEEIENFSFESGKTDIFGLTQEDWELLFENFENGTVGIQDMIAAASVLNNVWSAYNQFVTAGEQRQLQQFEQNNNKKKASLKKSLDSGLINQDKYHSEVEKLDADLDRQKAEFEYNQAKRQRNVALMGAIVNTAQAVTKALPNLILAGIVGVMGGLQVATILKTPLPEVPGREDGGSLIEVTRAQDGKRFRAKNDPKKRGFIKSPTVITGESGEEFVLNDAAVKNPTIAPVLDIIDTAQKNGTISTLKLDEVLGNTSSGLRLSGRQSGGHLADQRGSSPAAASNPSPNEELLMQVLQQSVEATNRLTRQLEQPIAAEVALLGKNGFVEKSKELDLVQANGNL